MNTRYYPKKCHLILMKKVPVVGDSVVKVVGVVLLSVTHT